VYWVRAWFSPRVLALACRMYVSTLWLAVYSVHIYNVDSKVTALDSMPAIDNVNVSRTGEAAMRPLAVITVAACCCCTGVIRWSRETRFCR